MASARPTWTPANLIRCLERCGYSDEHIVRDYGVPDAQGPGILAFSHAPHDARTACIAVADAGVDPRRTAEAWRVTGAPVLFLVAGASLTWWQAGPIVSQRPDRVSPDTAAAFFERHRQDFGPEALYRAKNLGRVRSGYQLDFVDVGLMPFVEGQMGAKLSALLEDLITAGSRLWPVDLGDAERKEKTHWLFAAGFHLLAAKILHDKRVASFRQINLANPEEAIRRVRHHYGQPVPEPPATGWQLDYWAEASQRIRGLSPLDALTTETLALVYESVLVSPQTRKGLGIHSTPGYLVDYVVWSLADWIAEIPPERRHAYEPCCGHAAFLIALMRLLREVGASNAAEVGHRYLQQRLHGLELDPFALEIARLGLTLADVPNPNGWDLQQGDVFVADWPAPGRPAPDIVFMNPPFEDLSEAERSRYADTAYVNRAAEVTARLLPRLNPRGVFGMVLPQGFLHGRNAEPLRRLLCRDFELREVTCFTDGLFSFSDAEAAVLIGRRMPAAAGTVHMGWVTGKTGIARFRELQALSDVETCPQQRLAESAGCELRIPRLDAVWQELAHLPRLGDWVTGGKGFEHVGKEKLPPGAQTVSDGPFPGAVRGFTDVGRALMLHGLPRERWVSLDRTVLRRPLHGTLTGQPQVLLNYAPVDRGPWRLKAVIDPEGHAVSSRFVALRPGQAGLSLEVLWAILNSPVGNGYAYCHLGKRDNTVGELLKMPVPRMSPGDVARVASAARLYLEAASTPQGPAGPEALRGLMLRVDAEVLRLCALPPRLERRLLDLFTGYPRLGVPFGMTEYFPREFTPCIPLHEYLSPEYRRTTAGELRKRVRPIDDPEITAALRAATEAFTLDEEA